MKNSDTPAMPIFNEKGGVLDLTNGHIEGHYISQEGRRFSIGLTKREHFAGLAMKAIIGRTDSPAPMWEECARDAVMAADALLVELEKSQ